MKERLIQYWIHMTADRRRFGVMCALIAVGLLLWGRLILLKNIPRTGYAKPDEELVVSDDGAEDQEHSGVINRRFIYCDLPTTLARDLFAVPSDYTKQASESTQSAEVASKLQVDQPDPVELERERVEAIRSEAGSMHVDSLIRGSVPLAVIDGHVLAVGNTLKGFVLEQVLERSIILSKGGVRVEIEMESPKAGE